MFFCGVFQMRMLQVENQGCRYDSKEGGGGLLRLNFKIVRIVFVMSFLIEICKRFPQKRVRTTPPTPPPPPSTYVLENKNERITMHAGWYKFPSNSFFFVWNI